MTQDLMEQLVRRYYLFTPGSKDIRVQIDEATQRMYDVCKDKSVRETIRFIWRRNEIAKQMCRGTYGLMDDRI